MELVKWLSIADRHTKMYLDRCLAPLGLNSSQHMYIIKICEAPGVTQDQFIHFFYIHPSNVTRSLAALEKAGFLRREENPEDKRTCRLFPTERAREAYPRILEILEEWQKGVLSAFTPEEEGQLLSLLRRAGEQAVELAAPEAAAALRPLRKEEAYADRASR